VTTADLAALKVAAAHAAQTVVVLERELAEARERHAAARRLLEDGVVRWLAAPVDVSSGYCPATLDGERCVFAAGHAGDHMAGGRQWVIELLQGPGLSGDCAQNTRSNRPESPESSEIASIPSIPGLNPDSIAATTTAAPTPTDERAPRWVSDSNPPSIYHLVDSGRVAACGEVLGARHYRLKEPPSDARCLDCAARVVTTTTAAPSPAEMLEQLIADEDEVGDEEMKTCSRCGIRQTKRHVPAYFGDPNHKTKHVYLRPFAGMPLCWNCSTEMAPAVTRPPDWLYCPPHAKPGDAEPLAHAFPDGESALCGAGRPTTTWAWAEGRCERCTLCLANERGSDVTRSLESDAIILCGAGGCFRRVAAVGDRCEDHPAKARPPKLCEVTGCCLPGASAPNSTGAWCPEHSKLPGEERRAIRAKSKELKREARLEKARAKKAAETPKEGEVAPW
jgi:hypothetical protein